MEKMSGSPGAQNKRGKVSRDDAGGRLWVVGRETFIGPL